MTAFATMLAERVEAYIELRRSLGYAFKKQAAILRALARYVEVGRLAPCLTIGANRRNPRSGPNNLSDTSRRTTATGSSPHDKHLV